MIRTKILHTRFVLLLCLRLVEILCTQVSCEIISLITLENYRGLHFVEDRRGSYLATGKQFENRNLDYSSLSFTHESSKIVEPCQRCKIYICTPYIIFLLSYFFGFGNVTKIFSIGMTVNFNFNREKC